MQLAKVKKRLQSKTRIIKTIQKQKQNGKGRDYGITIVKGVEKLRKSKKENGNNHKKNLDVQRGRDDGLCHHSTK